MGAALKRRNALIIIGCSVIIFFGTLIAVENNSYKTKVIMIDEKLISREWIEIREDSKDDMLVFRPANFPIPPARGRRHLKLTTEGQAKWLDAGPTDKLETASEGNWKIDKNKLFLNIPGWEKEYEIVELNQNKMVLIKRQGTK